MHTCVCVCVIVCLFVCTYACMRVCIQGVGVNVSNQSDSYASLLPADHDLSEQETHALKARVSESGMVECSVVFMEYVCVLHVKLFPICTTCTHITLSSRPPSAHTWSKAYGSSIHSGTCVGNSLSLSHTHARTFTYTLTHTNSLVLSLLHRFHKSDLIGLYTKHWLHSNQRVSLAKEGMAHMYMCMYV
jgi:biotin-(acetyl-CoA carboxylase) ligase